MQQKKVIFLDRDGTLIVDKIYLNDPQQVEFLAGVFAGLVKLRDDGFEFVVCTNQSGIPRGLVTLENLHAIHRRMDQELEEHGLKISAYYFAPYMTDSDHPLRKPNPGMLLQAAKEHGIDLQKSWMIGDRMLDVEAGHRAGTRAILLEGRETPEGSDFSAPEAFVPDINGAADFILRSRN